MDDIDRQILVLFQRDIPLKPAPFEILSRMIRVNCGELLLRVNRLQEEGLLGGLRAFFSAEALGYRTYTAALQISPEKLDRAVYYISGHPGVIRCTRWQGVYNLWFTLVLPAAESLEFHCQHLRNLADSKLFLLLETAKAFKPQGRPSQQKIVKPEDSEEWTALERSLIRSLSEDFPLTDHPFRKVAKDLNSSEELVLKQLQFFQKRGILKRIAAAPAGREEGFEEEVLSLWQLPEEKADEAGIQAAQIREVFSCVKRSPGEGMPYNLHVLLKGKNRERLEKAVEEIEGLIGMWPRHLLIKEKEIKRTRFKIFSDEIAEWRIQYAGNPVSAEPAV